MSTTETTDPQTTTVEWRDHTLTLPASLDDCDVDVLEAFENGKLIAALSGILGAKQYGALKASGLKVRDLNDLADVVAKSMGFGDSGE